MPKKALRRILKNFFQSITIMIIPHTSNAPFNIKIPLFIIILFIVCFCGCLTYIFTETKEKIEYQRMKQKLEAYSREFKDLSSTLEPLKENEKELRRLLAYNSKDEIIKNFESDNASDKEEDLDFIELKKEVANTIDSVESIKRYLSSQKDIFRSTPKGLPVSGDISSRFGQRIHPIEDREHFHNGVDVTVKAGTPVKVTADGFVSFSGYYKGYGNMVIVEHGLGFSTLYAHNSKNVVTVGQHVKRGDIIAYAGSTGNAQTSHVHYSVFKNGKPLDPLKVFRAGK
ncbi:MAG TPA: peptidoglycan DD-metalloendopeptidase family protein [Syntrophorhabdaceae bacterium]|nr:peptidoglycan DD-metalloendopeptidase family protein [Syntrophorhabdaceae bacterium]